MTMNKISDNPALEMTGTINTLSREETLQLRSQYISNACKLHFEKSPMKVVRGNAQYLYDDGGNEYLDCVNCVAHVGHCNPFVVEAAKTAMLQMGNISLGGVNIVSDYLTQLKATFPPDIDTFLFVSSASEANDLAIQMARLHTGAFDVVAVERNFHGGITLPNYVSPRQFSDAEKCPNWVHVLPCPDLYRGKYTEAEVGNEEAVEKYCKDASTVIKAVFNNNRKLACLIAEPIMTKAGIILPPSKWLHSIYNDIRKFGGLAIADEAQSGLGRSGTSMWCFQQHDNLIPDIITVGKPLGNGHPMACIATKSVIASALLKNGDDSLDYACDLVSAAVGLAVLNHIRSYSLQKNSKNVGDFFREGIRSLGTTHHYIGEGRGKGLMIGVEIVYSQESRKPARDIAERICYKMLDHFIVVANDGPMKNILIFTPPLCFTCENAHRVIIALGKVLKEIEEEPPDDGDLTSGTEFGRDQDQLVSFDELTNLNEENEGVLLGGFGDVGESSLDEDDFGYGTSNSYASMD